MDILENELVHAYFGCKQPCPDGDWPVHPGTCRSVESESILKAMQQPVRKGDRLLNLSGCESEVLEAREVIADSRWNDRHSGFHALWLRLPDYFQKGCPVEEMLCPCGHRFKHPKPTMLRNNCADADHKYRCECPKAEDAVEEKIKLFHSKFRTHATFIEIEVDKELRDLVRLAKEKK